MANVGGLQVRILLQLVHCNELFIKFVLCSFVVQVSTFSTTILSAMLAGMDDREDPEDLITMEAMSGLARIFEQIDEGHVRPILINIALRIRPCFEKVGKIGFSSFIFCSFFAYMYMCIIILLANPCCEGGCFHSVWQSLQVWKRAK